MIKKTSTDFLSIIQLIIATAKTAHPNCKPQHYHRFARFVYRAWCNKKMLVALIQRINAISTPQPIAVDTDHAGVIVWPYLCNEWGIETRCDVIANHYESIAAKNYHRLNYVKQQPLTLIELSQYADNTRIVIDKPIWFRREGELVINLFQGELRVVSVAFVVQQHHDQTQLMIGAVQGIHAGVSTDESLAIFKALTKDFCGLRPRSLVIEVLRNLGAHMGVTSIQAIADQHRHHRHHYFGKSSTSELAGNYDTIWQENGGWIDANGATGQTDNFYQLPTQSPRKPIEDIASKKRSLYRRRYEMLDTIATDVKQSLDSLNV